MGYWYSKKEKRYVNTWELTYPRPKTLVDLRILGLHAKKVKKTAVCLCMFSIPAEYSDSEAMRERNRYYEEILANPNPEHPHELLDYITRTHYLYKDGVVRCISMNETSIDGDLVIKAAEQIEPEDRDFKKDKYMAYLFGLLKSGRLGIGCQDMSAERFVEFIAPFKKVSKSNINKYKDKPSIYDILRIIEDVDYELSLTRTSLATKYISLFKSKYNELYARKYAPNGYQLESLPELLSIREQ